MGKFGVWMMFIVLIAILVAGFLWFTHFNNQSVMINPSGSSSTTSATIPTLVLGTPTGTTADSQTTSDGIITFNTPSDFGLATTQQQISVNSYIPPCDPGFTYCLYYTGTAHQGTNFDSAGIRITKRNDLATQTACLTAPPTGYANFTPTSTTIGDYSLSEFTPLGDAGAGHSAVDTLYRLAYNGACYEFETRIGQSQFANYPSGTIQQFTAADQAALRAEMESILDNVSLPSGETITFPS